MQIGEFRIDPLLDGEIVLPPERVYPTKTAADWAGHEYLLDDQGRYVNSIGGFLIRDGTCNVVVDAGIGPTPPEPFTGGQFLAQLEALDVRPADVTHVLFTHLHFDHVGWATQDGQATFPNATYVVHADDWRLFASDQYRPVRTERPADRPSLRLEPVIKNATLWSGPSLPVVSGVTLRHLPGHTPGTAIVQVDSGGKRGLLIGDVAHNAIELIVDGWPGVADQDPVAARAAAAAIAKELIAGELPFTLAHFPGLRWARLTETRGRRRLDHI